MPDGHSPLLRLAAKLLVRPPLLSDLAQVFHNAILHQDFVDLVTMVAPSEAARVLALPGPEERMAAFLRHVDRNLFPVDTDAGWEGDYEWVLDRIPLALEGLTEDDLHSGDWPIGRRLAWALVEHPYGGDNDGWWVWLVESCGASVPQDLLARLPHGGYPLEALQERLHGTPYEGLVDVRNILHRDTDTYYFDYSDEDGFDMPEWDADTVKALAGEWARAKAIMERATAVEDLLEAAPVETFRRILEAMEASEHEHAA
jgi:hypothetical protein